MGFMNNLFEAASNIAATAVNTAKSLPDGLNNALEGYVRGHILQMASLLKKSDENRLGGAAPNWFYMEMAKKSILSDYNIPEDLKSDYQRYSSTFSIPALRENHDNYRR